MWLYIPMIYKGYSPFLAAVLVAGITTFMTMYLLGGWCRKTVCAAAGTISGVIIAGISAFLFGKAAHISGYNVSNIEALVQGISGSMGVVLTVPMVSLFSFYAAEAGYLKKQVEKEG